MLPQLSILYGSATGNAEHIAKDLASTVESKSDFYSSVVCCELNKFQKQCLKGWESELDRGRKHPVIVITSTTGNGDAPENAGRFCRYLKRKTSVELQPFRNVAFAVLALGDTNYDMFCNTGKLVNRKMEELGGTRAKALGCADEGTGLEEVVEPWIATVMVELRAAVLSSDDESGEEKKEEVETVDVTEERMARSNEKDAVLSSATEALSRVGLSVNETTNIEDSEGVRMVREWCRVVQGLDLKQMYDATCAKAPSFGTRMQSEFVILDESEIMQDTSEVMEEEFDENEPTYTESRPWSAPILGARYLTQTTAGLSKDDRPAPSTPRDERRVIELTLGLPLENFNVKPGDSVGIIVTNDYVRAYPVVLKSLASELDKPVSGKTTVQEVVRTRLDLSGPLRPRTVATLATACTVEIERQAMTVLAHASDSGKSLAHLRHMDVGDLLEMFPSCSPTFAQLCAACDRLTPRYYSACGIDKARVSVAFSVVDYMREKRRARGLATTWLERTCASLLTSPPSSCQRTVSIYPTPSSGFGMPDPITPMVLVGPGTGVAPFLAFLQQRQQDFIQHKKIGRTVLYFGCRWDDHDFLFRDELLEFAKQEWMELHVAVSRADVHKKYVQDFFESTNVVQRIIDEDAIVYVCGDGQGMARDVQDRLAQLLPGDGKTYLEEMKRRGKLRLDVWTS